jgi:hypothetical protein
MRIHNLASRVAERVRAPMLLSGTAGAVAGGVAGALLAPAAGPLGVVATSALLALAVGWGAAGAADNSGRPSVLDHFEP